MKPREWWIYKGSNKVQNDPNHLDPFYDTVMTESHAEAVHVIEKSAYEEEQRLRCELAKFNVELTDKYEALAEENEKLHDLFLKLDRK